MKIPRAVNTTLGVISPPVLAKVEKLTKLSSIVVKAKNA